MNRLKHLLPNIKSFHLPEVYHSIEQSKPLLNRLIHKLQKARSTLIITGAGISTASGIPDYRSPLDTKIPIGAGQYNRETPLQFKPVTHAVPSFTHLAISQLVRNNIISSVLTQNVDNLHSKALLPSRCLVQVHGNVCKEYCQNCGLLHYRNYYCRQRSRPKDLNHFNGRQCDTCNGKLMDSLVFFGESYGNLTRTKLDYLNADLIIAVGTSLTIPSIQRLIKRLKCLTYIINLQKTALPEQYIHTHIHSDIQESFRYIMDQLKIPVLPFRIIYNMTIEEKGQKQYTLNMYDFQMTPVDCIKQLIVVRKDGQKIKVDDRKTLENVHEMKEIRINLYSYHNQQQIVIDQKALLDLCETENMKHLQWSPDLRRWNDQSVI